MAKVKETTFVAEVASWINIYLANNKELPFTQAKVEESPKGSRKRRDLILYDRDGKVALSGEVKMPDAKDGQSPYNEAVVTDAFKKARSRYFFTWNVNRFVLWDTQMSRVAFLQRRARQWELLQVKSSEDVSKPHVTHKIRDEFVPELLETFARIYKGDIDFGAHPPDEHFIFMLESFLERPVDLTLNYVYENFPSNRGFSKSFRKWMVEQGWTVLESIPESQKEELLERAAKLSCYVLANKLIFYEALRRQFPKLKKMSIPTSVDNVDRMEGKLAEFFAKAQKESGDYETLFWPDFGARLPLFARGAIDAWRDVIKQIVVVDLKDIDYDVLGNIFERLIDPDERHKYGQHYTDAHIVDVINAFTIRDGNEIVMDPACGSGTFLVRAYARKRVLTKGVVDHQTLLRQLYGVDISGYAVHLSSVGLATRDLVKAKNYPRVFRQDFFDLRPGKTYSVVPGKKEAKAHSLSAQPALEFTIPTIDAGVGNPPYIRQETIKRKEYYQDVVKREAPGFNLSGRSDIYVYFWPHIVSFLKEDGTLGLLTSSSWLDVEYGFRLQKWFLNNFKIVAVLESVCEPWFTQARVATAVTILKRCKDESKRMDNKVRFVQLKKPLDEILENDGTEKGRLEAANDFRDKIESITDDTSTDQYRIICRTQKKLWEEGLEPEEENPRTERKYRGGKWGVYLRAPDLFFEIMSGHSSAFITMEKIADVRFGVKSGCDGFFYPRDISKESLAQHGNPKEFKEYYGVTRDRVEKGTMRIVRAGDGSVWPIESEYLQPEVHSLMEIKSPKVDGENLKHQILLVKKSKAQLKKSLVRKYIEFGEKSTMGRAGGTPIPDRSTVKQRTSDNREWYDLTSDHRGVGFWPKSQQYRHIIAINTEKFICNCNLYDLIPHSEDLESNPKLLIGILNSTVVLLIKQHYGRLVGREGNLKTEIVDVNMMPIPNPYSASPSVAKRITEAFNKLASRESGYILEEAFRQTKRYRTAEKMKDDPIQLPQELRQKDRQELDDAVLELIGVSDPKERVKLRKRLYEEVTKFYRQVRLLELQAIENKNRSKRKTGITAQKIADDIWDELPEDTLKNYPDNFLKPDEETDSYVLPDGKAKFLYATDMINKPTLKFPERKIEFRHKTQAELVLALHDAGYTGSLSLPIKETRCKEVLQKWNEYLDNLRETFEDMGYERSGDEERVMSAVDILMKKAMNG